MILRLLGGFFLALADKAGRLCALHIELGANNGLLR